MKLLIVTYFYAPDLTPRAFRWTALASHLVRKGHQVDVLCASMPSGKANDRSDGVTVYRVRDWLLDASARVTVGAGEVPKTGDAVLPTLRAFARRLFRALWRAVYWPDFACGWVIPAVRKAHELCAHNGYDWIISVSHPFTGHLVGLLAKRRSPEVRWLVDIGDPFSFLNEPSPNNPRLYSALNRTIERKVLKKADTASATTAETKRLYQEYFAVEDGKITVIPPMLSLPRPVAPLVTRTDGVIKLAYVGTLYRTLRSPESLLALFRALVEICEARPLELHFYGSVNDCADVLAPYLETAGSRVFAHGLVSRPEVLRAMCDADVLVNIGNRSAAQLATKIVEYMALGKPILNLVSIDRDASVAELADYPASFTIARSDEVTSPDTVARVLSFVTQSRPVSESIMAKVRKRYSEEHVASLYVSLLDRNQ